MKIQAVFFDMDGVMFDTERLSSAMWLKYAPSVGMHLVPEDLLLVRGRNASDGRAAFLAHFGADAPFDALCEASRAELTETLAKHVPILPGLPELLAFLKSENLPLAVVSSTRKALVVQHLQSAGISEYFSALICGDMVEHSKPAPDIYLKAAAEFGLDPENCLVLEDSYNGVRAGHAANCYTVMIPNMDPATPETETLTSAIVPSLFDVIDLVKQINIPR